MNATAMASSPTNSCPGSTKSHCEKPAEAFSSNTSLSSANSSPAKSFSISTRPITSASMPSMIDTSLAVWRSSSSGLSAPRGSRPMSVREDPSSSVVK